MTKKSTRYHTRGQVLDSAVTEVESLIRQGKIERMGSWYQVNDLQVLSDEFFGIVKRMFVNKQKTLVQLYN